MLELGLLVECCEQISDYSVWLIVAVTCERYLVVCHPFRANTFCGTPVARRLVLGLLLAFLGLNSHFFWTVGVVRYCRHGQPHHQCSAGHVDYVELVTVGYGVRTVETELKRSGNEAAKTLAFYVKCATAEIRRCFVSVLFQLCRHHYTHLYHHQQQGVYTNGGFGREILHASLENCEVWSKWCLCLG